MALELQIDPPVREEILKRARELKALGGDAEMVLRRAIREAMEPAPAPEHGDRATAILNALKWLATPEATRSSRPPALRPLSETEGAAVREAIGAVGMGIDVTYSLGMDAFAEDLIRSEADRKAGRLANIDDVPVLELLRETSAAIDSWRVRDRLRDWLPRCSSREAQAALRELRKERTYGDREWAGILVLRRVDFLRSAGLSEAAAVAQVAKEGVPYASEDDPKGYRTTEELPPALPPMSIGVVRSRLRDGKKAYFVPRQLPRTPRPNRSKSKTTGF